MVTVTIRFYGLIRLLKKLTVATPAVKTDCIVNAVVSGGTQRAQTKNSVKRQTVNCLNTLKRSLVYDYRKPTEHRKIIRHKESFGVFRFTAFSP